MAKITIDKYDSKTGAGTLSYYARQYGTTVDALAKSNNITDPNLIQAGGSLVVPDSGVQKSTTSFRQQSEQNMSKYDEFTTKHLTAAEQAKLDQAAKDQIERDNAANTSKDEVVDPFEGLDDKKKQLQDEAESQVADITRKYDSIQRFVDTAHANIISATKQIYAARLEKMRDSNKRLLATKDVANMRQGRSRYVPELAGGILNDEELNGLDRLGEVEGELMKAIAEADKAKAEGDMERFNASFDNINTIMDRSEKQIKANYDNAVAQDKAIRDREKADRDAAKMNFEMSLDRAKTAAPAIADQLETYGSEAEQMAFLEAYSKKTGIDLDIIMGEVVTAAQDKDYKNLQIENLQNQITNRDSTNARGWASERRLQAEADRKAGEEDEVSDTTKNVISGASLLDELTGEAREKTKADLRDLGYYNDTPPAWFIEMSNDESGATVEPSTLKQKWEEHRQSIISGGV